MCFDGYSMVNYTDSSGILKQACMIDFCPQGMKKKQDFNGFTWCEPCNITACDDCVDIQAQVFKDSQLIIIDSLTNFT